MGYVQRGVAVDTLVAVELLCLSSARVLKSVKGEPGKEVGSWPGKMRAPITVRSVKMKPTAPCIPRRSPIQVLTEPYVA